MHHLVEHSSPSNLAILRCAAVIKASKEPPLEARLQESGVITKTSTPEELRQLMKTEVELVGRLAKSLGMAPN